MGWGTYWKLSISSEFWKLVRFVFFNYLKKSNHLPNRRGFSVIIISVPSLVFHAVVFLMAGVNGNLRCIWIRVNRPQPSPGMASQHQPGVPATWRWASPTCRKAFGPLPYFSLPDPCTPYLYGNEHAVHWDFVAGNRGLRGLLCVWGFFQDQAKRTVPGAAWKGPDSPQPIPCLAAQILSDDRTNSLVESLMSSIQGGTVHGWDSTASQAVVECSSQGSDPCVFRLLDRHFSPEQADLGLWCGRPLFGEAWSWWLRS